MNFQLKLALFSALFIGVDCANGDGEHFEYNEGSEAVPDEYLVTLKQGILSTKASTWLQSFLTKVKEKYGCTIKRHFTFDRVKSFRIKGVFEKIQKLKEIAEVAYVEKNLYVKAIQDAPSNASVCYEENTGRNMWGLSRISRRESMPLLFRTSYSWGSKDNGEGVDAYILDTGIDVTHSDFEGRARWGYTAASIVEDEVDFQGHGTHVAGTVGGRTYGVAKAVKLVAVKVLNAEGIGTMADIIEGIQFAYDDMRAKAATTGLKPRVVLNLSLGGKGRVQALEQVINDATAAGMVIVVAAGNEYDDACLYTPSHITSAITVGAMNIDDNMSEFSNYGRCVDVLAAGEGILSTYPGGGTAISQGTSMAAPHVAGAVARYLSRSATSDTPPTPAQVKQMMSDDATMNKINLAVGTDPSIRLTTPNRLLYMTCSGPSTLSGSASVARQSLITGAVMIFAILLCH